VTNESEGDTVIQSRRGAESILFGSYNLLDYGTGEPDQGDHEQRVAEVIGKLDVDVLAVQEIRHADPAVAAARFAELAEACGLRCQLDAASGGGVALAPATSGFHVGLLWRPGIEPVAGRWRAYGAGEFWHALAVADLDIGGPVPVTFAAYHADPFRPHRRFDEAYRVAGLLRGGPALIGADWNNIGADRRPNGDYHDPDPYPAQSWYAELIHQVRWSDDPGAPPEADRRPAELLRRGGLIDAATALDAEWERTTGYWPGGNRFGPRRTDAVRVTRHLLPALRGYRVERGDTALAASDHLPVVVEFEPARIEPVAG
jgi:hypothetical protein